MNAVREAGELALEMADMDAGYGDYRDALNWLDVYEERQDLPEAYEVKRLDWLEQMGAGAHRFTRD